MQLPNQDRQTAMTRSGHVLTVYAGLGLAALLLSAGRGDVDLYRLEESGSALWLLLSPLLGVPIGLLVVVLSRLSTTSFAWARRLHQGFRNILGEQSDREILILALASSVGEELFFRGALLPWLGVWPQALLFALLHIGPGRRFLPWTLAALVIGALLGYLCIATGNLGAAILVHFTINFLNLRYIVHTDLEPRTPARAPAS